MIQLNDKLGNPIYVNPDHIVMMGCCMVSDKCDLTFVDEGKFEGDYLAVRLYLVTGKSLIVRDCMAEINRRIDNG